VETAPADGVLSPPALRDRAGGELSGAAGAVGWDGGEAGVPEGVGVAGAGSRLWIGLRFIGLPRLSNVSGANEIEEQNGEPTSADVGPHRGDNEPWFPQLAGPPGPA
jgi:hypothetical protein